MIAGGSSGAETPPLGCGLAVEFPAGPGPAGDTTDLCGPTELEDAVMPGAIWLARMTEPVRQYIKTRTIEKHEDCFISFSNAFP